MRQRYAFLLTILFDDDAPPALYGNSSNVNAGSTQLEIVVPITFTLDVPSGLHYLRRYDESVSNYVLDIYDIPMAQIQFNTIGKDHAFDPAWLDAGIDATGYSGNVYDQLKQKCGAMEGSAIIRAEVER